MHKLYIHVGEAKHFLEWEKPEFGKYFTLVDAPSNDAILLSFGPDVLEAASQLPARARFAVLFPGFNCNPLHNKQLRDKQIKIIKDSFVKIFINKGPLEIAYKSLDNVEIYPFSVDIEKVKFKRYRRHVRSAIHISSNSPQKDWERSERVLKELGLPFEVYPPREAEKMEEYMSADSKRTLIQRLKRIQKPTLPYGYLSHEMTIKKYNQYDAFVHIAKDIKHEKYLDGMYTASLIEAGLTGAIIFWHDTYGVGGYLSSVFEVSADPTKAAAQIKKILASLDVYEWSKKTRREMLEIFNPQKSVKLRAESIIQSVNMV